MISKRYTFLLLLPCFLAFTQNAQAQCTTDAGTISGPSFLCEGNTLSINNMANETLDSNDVLIFVVYTGAAPNAATVLATSTTVNFPYQSSFLINSPFKVAAVAGNNAGGGLVDWDDPCLSVSNVLTVTCLPPPILSINPPGVLNCLSPSVMLITTVNQQPVTFNWSGPNNFSGNMMNPTVNAPGQYCVTVTNQAGCTAEACVTVLADAPLPVADAGSDMTLTCFNLQVTLDASGSSIGPNYVYQWVGPGISPANQSLINPAVNVAGTYQLIVTDVVNGCTASDFVVVNVDISTPVANAGPDTGIPCGGGTTTLSASSSGQNPVFAWSGPNGYFANIPNPTVSEPGVYILTVTNSINGCTSTDQAIVFPGPAIPQQDFEVTNAQCFGDNSGAIGLTPSVGVQPFDFDWGGPAGFSANTEDISGLIAGTYNLTATDATGCTHYATVQLLGPSAPLTANFTVGGISCQGNDGSIVLSVSGGILPYHYTWSNGATGPVVQGLVPGTYVVTITDANGCTEIVGPITVAQSFPVSLTVNELSNTCEEVILQPVVLGGVFPITYSWIGPNGFTSNDQTIVVQSSGLYTLVVVDALGCSQSASYAVQVAGGSCGYISGHVIRDISEDCVVDTGEPGLAGWLVRADGATDTIYGVTNADGKYFIGVPLGDYTATAIAPNNLWEVCPPGTLVSVNVAGDTFPGGDIPAKQLYDCPALTVSIGTSQLRRCFSNNHYFVDYCNDGTAAAEDAYVLVTLDPFLSPVSASLPYVNLGNNVLRFDLGDVAVNECGTFSLQVLVSCNAVLGQTHCTEAHIYPDSTCLPNHPLWSGASLQVSSLCNNDSVRFTVKNIGQGDMTSSVDYVIIEDAVLMMSAPLPPLQVNESVTLAFPANGSTWRLEVDQVPFHPGNSQPSLSIEGCSANTAFSTGFVTQFPNNDADAWIDIDCTPNIGSYDPNDKQGFPVGYGASHYIRPGTELEYLIRFQNTGTDTAFTVRIVDTLSAWLDPATIRPSVSSHTYQFNLKGPGIVEFLYENILLPDSNVNEPASNGFVKFSILPRADAPLETVIENDAAIYFDFNEPVITNTTFHRLGENFVVSGWQPFMPGAEVKVSPNPFSEQAIVEVKGLRSTAPLRLRMFDLQGKIAREMETSSTIFTLQKNNWPAGVYLFSVFQEGKIVGSGKLMVK
ncbi:MAG: hypothetical protein OHK0019_02130 [Saprospiraceae bacterium]